MSLKTVLQITLAIRNIMSQSASDGMRTDRLPSLDFDKIGRGNTNGVTPTSVLALVVQMLEGTHTRRANLRFHRMMAVGRLVPKDSARKIVWSFLGNLGDSPWDCLPLLAECNPELCSRDMLAEITDRHRHMRILLQTKFVTVASAAADGVTTSQWCQQLEAFERSVEDAVATFELAIGRLVSAIASIKQLFGEQAGVGAPQHRWEDHARSVFVHLRMFGSKLSAERQSREAARIRDALQIAGGGSKVRSWPPIDTTTAVLNATTDTDLIRALGLMLPSRGGGAGTHGGPEGNYERDPVTGEWVAAGRTAARAGPSGADLMHGGADGAYTRDPITGRWTNAYTGRAHDGPEGIDLSSFQ